MNWFEQIFEQISILEIILKGFIVGVVVSAPLGPVGVLCIQRTLNKGRWYGFVTGLGAALSDIIYALITSYGMNFVAEFIENPQTMYWFQLIGSVVLFGFGVYTFRSNPVESIRPVSANKGSLVRNFVTAFFVTFSNPFIILLYIGLFARFSFVFPDNYAYEQTLGYLAIVGGAITWWFLITYLVNKLRTRFDLRGIWILNRIIGSVVMLASVVSAIFTLTGKTLY